MSYVNKNSKQALESELREFILAPKNQEQEQAKAKQKNQESRGT
jgi:hypothetical protein